MVQETYPSSLPIVHCGGQVRRAGSCCRPCSGSPAAAVPDTFFCGGCLARGVGGDMVEPAITDGKDITYASFILRSTGLSPVGSPSFAEWVEVGHFIRRAANACTLWL